MSKIAFSSNVSGSGVFTISSPNSNTDRALTLPDAAGAVVLDSATQTLTNKSIDAAQLTDNIAAARLTSANVVITDSVQTLTNKTLTNPTVSAINSGPLAGFRNAIINGNFDFWQRGTSFSNADGAYTSDRWLMGFDGTGATRTISRQVFTLGQTDVPGEPTAFYRFDQSVAGSGGTYNVIVQRIEGVRTFAGQQVTVSFFARGAASLTMPFMGFRQSFGTGGSPSAFVDTNFGFSTVVGTTFTRFSFTVTIPSISGKTLGTDGNDNLELSLLLPVNTTFTFDLASVQIELGPVATPFERRPLGTELALCQRYYCRTLFNIRFRAQVASEFHEDAAYWPQTMRAAPTATILSPEPSDCTGTIDNAFESAARIRITSTTTGDVFLINTTIEASAEL